ncbi:MAG: hypothetical protein VCC67_10855 [Myxococcota bacterium]
MSRVAISVGLTLLVVAAMASQGGDLSPQSRVNLAFALEPSYDEALARLGHRWPPLYPSLLWAGARVGMPPDTTNLLLFLATLAALVPAARWAAPAIAPVFPVVLYAVCAFNYWNLHQLVSEALLVPLALGVLLLAERCHRDDPARAGYARNIASLTALAAAACLTRYFAIFWLLPLAAWVAAGPPGSRRLVRAGSVLAIAAAPVGLWMAHARSITGHLTGMDRFAPRSYETLTTFTANLELAARSLAMDWFGTSGPASHAALRGSWQPSMLDAGLLGLASAVVVACGIAGFRAARAGTASPPARRADSLLLVCFSVGHVGWVVLLWTIGNNDPIYSRFLYPSYVFFLLAGFHAYSNLKPSSHSHAQGAWLRAPFLALFALVLAVQALATLGMIWPAIAGTGG